MSRRLETAGLEARDVGDPYLIEPGHDAWAVGDEAFVDFGFEAAQTYARR